MKSLLKIKPQQAKHQISRHIYGHFAEHLGRLIYEDGIYVGESSSIPNIRGFRTDIIEALRALNIPNLRWPGGCFADEYHWRDGIGNKNNRPSIINNNWGGVVENNHFGTHEFMDLCELLDTEPYICGNVGSGTVQEIQQWVEYMTFDGVSPMTKLRKENGRDEPWKLQFFGIGNENWGCGGRMRAEYYADLYRQFSLFAMDYGDNKLFKVAAGPRGDNYYWTEVLMREARFFMDGLGLHYYTRLRDHSIVIDHPDGNRSYLRNPDANRGDAVDFQEDEWFGIMKAAYFTDELITKHSAIMDKYDPEKKVALVVDEWGTWFDVEPGTNTGFLYQQNTMRDAVSAAISLNIFNNHSDRVRLANLAQVVNVLQAVILTKGESMVLTPTYHVFEMYKVHMDATLLPIHLITGKYAFGSEQINQLSVSASRNEDGVLHVTIANSDPNHAAELETVIDGLTANQVSGRILTSDLMNRCNTFENPNQIKPETFDQASVVNGGIRANIPPMSVVLLTIQ